MRLQLFGVGSVPVLTLPLKSDDDSIINLSAPAPWLDMNEQRCLTILRLKGGDSYQRSRDSKANEEVKEVSWRQD
ncbi:hypothetical protein NNQ27_22670 (plasmid) [Cronobacter dublinensis subsp. infanticibi]|uniref:hypothetical protein n=1 Tax=Cronobacter dublinensis TaxID=413497 RepID=UPI0023DD1DB4|nr:hypothetical protein [Cronobacter dublinensis]WEP47679.1 hypothetical protein NNQ27_22670 [Cronobacter dublinensis]